MSASDSTNVCIRVLGFLVWKLSKIKNYMLTQLQDVIRLFLNFSPYIDLIYCAVHQIYKLLKNEVIEQQMQYHCYLEEIRKIIPFELLLQHRYNLIEKKYKQSLSKLVVEKENIQNLQRLCTTAVNTNIQRQN
ncbi:Hypothetical_protein [Hexamita inflata]|uniref:Hypothetical_protein n=1 Tax=Hexamita inflata TaxID=28002 RepID=A0AA86R3P6_9EUKA|nr:Hypothetical protein HINF_LOCUS54116 [Hexamita inflata]CAI9966475.1 Hypothetical protein HINF_LOCUS54120 [Hexamita inflata]